MTRFLKQSTAVDVVIGPFVDDTDGKTPETGLTISQADCQLSKNGGAVAQKNDSTSASHLGGGHYKVPLNTTDTNTLGQLRLYVNESGALPVWADFMVVTANIYDSLFSTDVLDVSVTQIGGSAVSTSTAQLGVNVVQLSGDGTAADNAEAFFDGTGYAGTNNVIPTVTTATNVTTVNGLAANVITAASMAADAGAEIADAVWDEALSGHTTSGTAGKGLSDAGAAGDPWSTALPGAYGAGTAGKILGDKAFNASQIGGSATAATTAGKAFQGIVTGTAVTGTLSTTVFTTNLTEATNDHYNGRTVTFISGVLAGQQATISDYNGSTKALTVAAMTEAPANGDEFFIA